PDHPQFQVIRRLYLYDPAPTLRQLRTPVLALFGELDNNILPNKNRDAWEAALKAGGNPDYTLRILGAANHEMFEAKVGNNKEMVSLQRFVPAYAATVESSELVRQALFSESFWKPATVRHPTPVGSPRAPTIREPRRRRDCK